MFSNAKLNDYQQTILTVALLNSSNTGSQEIEKFAIRKIEYLQGANPPRSYSTLLILRYFLNLF